MKLIALLIVLLCIMPVNVLSTNQSYHKDVNTSFSNTVQPNKVADAYSKQLNIYIQALINAGEPTASNGLRWKKYLNLPWNESNPGFYNYSQYYFGLYYGVAGIGSVFLELYHSTGNTTYLLLAEKCANYLLLSAGESNNGWYYWTRATDSNAIYSSEKYGLAGIATFLLSLYQDTTNNTFLDYAEKTLDLLYYFRVPTSSGDAYDYWIGGSNTPITDFMYGVTGVAKGFLKAYHVTGNETYLKMSVNAMSYVLNQSAYTVNNENGMRKILYSQDISYYDNFTGYQSGAAGIGDFLLTLYNTTKQSDYLLYAKQIANWLIYKEDGKGIWTSYNAVDYLTDQETINSEGTFLGYSAGSAGVAIFLMDLYQATNNNSYLGPVVRVKNMLLSNASSIKPTDQIYWKDQLTGHFDNRIDTGLSMGVAGIGLFFVKYYQMFGSTESLDILQGINNFYGNITTVNGLVPSTVNASKVIYDSSYLEGLAGIIDFFLKVNNSMYKNPLYNTSVLNNLPDLTFTKPVSWTTLYTNTLNTSTTNFTGSNSASNSVTGNNSSKTANFTLLPIILVLTISLVSIRRKRKGNN